MQAVEVEAVESGLLLGRQPLVVSAEPGYELVEHGVPPHPLRKTPESRERLVCRGVIAESADEPVHAPRIGPVPFDGDRAKPALFDECSRDGRAKRVELVRAVRRFAKQHEPRIADALEQRVHVGSVVKRRREGPDQLAKL